LDGRAARRVAWRDSNLEPLAGFEPLTCVIGAQGIDGDDDDRRMPFAPRTCDEYEKQNENHAAAHARMVTRER